MISSTSSLLLALAATAYGAGFNYGSTDSANNAMTESSFEALFKRAQALPGTNGIFNEARLYTMIQAGTTNTPITAIQAAKNTGTKLLLGLWASQNQDAFNNELAALNQSIAQFGDLVSSGNVVGISVGSEDLYRITPTGITNKAGVGQDPTTLTSYINQVKAIVAASSWKGAQVGHVDTWTAWVNSTNNDVIAASDFLGVDGYPYFQNTEANSIENSPGIFEASIQATQGASQGKPVWITETGWPVSGPTENQAVPSTDNAKKYWDAVGCPNFDNGTPTFWFTLQDASPNTPSPSFGIIGSDLNSAPMYDLSCAGVSNQTTSASSSATASASSGSATSTATSSSSSSSSSGSSSSSSSNSTSGSAGGSNPNAGGSSSSNTGSGAPSGSGSNTTSSSGSSSSGTSTSGSGSGSSSSSSSAPAASTSVHTSAAATSGVSMVAVVLAAFAALL